MQLKIPFLHKKNEPDETQEASPLHLEREGQAWVKQISNTARKEPWQVLLLELAWTAGPATFVAAWAGYYLGFGKAAPSENLVFFIAYTVIFGLIGLFTRVASNATFNRRQRETEQNLLEAVDKLSDVIIAARDIHLQSLDPESRKLEANGMLLQRVELDVYGVRMAIEELTGDEALARAAGYIELYRRSGLYSRMREVRDTITESSKACIAEVSEKAPMVGNLLRRRLNGDAPDLEEGIPRDENFIERILSAIEFDEESLMTLLDVEEMLILAFELLNGREIPMLTFAYSGRWDMAQATDQLEARRNLYRISKLTGYSRLKAMVAILADCDATSIEGLTRGSNAETLLEQGMTGIRQMCNAIEQVGAEVRTGQVKKRIQLRRALKTLQSALRLYDAARRAYNNAGRRHAVLLHAIRKWNSIAERYDNLEVMPEDAHRRGLQIIERQIALEDDQKIEFAHKLVKLFEQMGICTVGQRVMVRLRNHHAPLSSDEAKTLAIEIASLIEDYIDISRPEVQRAINGTNAANLGAMELGLSAHTKIGWGSALVQEVQNKMDHTAERLATTLVNTYNLRLSDEAIEFLHEHYGARTERLETLMGKERRERLLPISSLQTRPPPMVNPDPEYRRQLYRAEQLIRRYSRVAGL